EDRLDRAEGKRAEQTGELALGGRQAGVVTEPLYERHRRSRLVGIELPRMHVEDDRSLLASVDAGQRAVDEGGRKQPEESAAEGQVHAGAARGADRHLPEVDALDVLRDVREARPVGEAVAVVDDG